MSQNQIGDINYLSNFFVPIFPIFLMCRLILKLMNECGNWNSEIWNVILQGNWWEIKTRKVSWHWMLSPTRRPLSASPITRASSNALHCLAPRLPASSPLKYKLKAHVISRSLSGFIEQGQDTPTEVMTIDNLSKKFLAIGEYCGVNHLSVRHIILRKRASPEREICWKPWVCIWTASEFDIEPFLWNHNRQTEIFLRCFVIGLCFLFTSAIENLFFYLSCGVFS